MPEAPPGYRWKTVTKINAMGRPYTTRILVPIMEQEVREPQGSLPAPHQAQAASGFMGQDTQQGVPPFMQMVTDGFKKSGGWPGQATTPQPTTPPDWRDSFVGRAPPRARKKDVTTVIKKSEDPDVATTETITIKGGLMGDVPTGQDDPQNERGMGMWDDDMAQLRARQQQGTAIAPEAEVRSIAGLANTQQEWDAQQAGRHQRLPPALVHAMNRGDKRAMIAAGNIGLEQSGLDPRDALAVGKVANLAKPLQKLGTNFWNRWNKAAPSTSPIVTTATEGAAKTAQKTLPRYGPRMNPNVARNAAVGTTAATVGTTAGMELVPEDKRPAWWNKYIAGGGRNYKRRQEEIQEKFPGAPFAGNMVTDPTDVGMQQIIDPILATEADLKAKKPVGGSGYQQWDDGVKDSRPKGDATMGGGPQVREESKAAAMKQIQANPNLAKVWGKFADDPAARKKAFLANRKDLFKKAMLLNLIAVMTGGESQAAAFLESKMAEFDQLELFDQEARLNNQWREVFTDAEGNFYMPKSQEEAAERGAKAGFSPKEMKQLFTAVPKQDKDKSYAPSNTAKMIAEMDVIREEIKEARKSGDEERALQLESQLGLYTRKDAGTPSTNAHRVRGIYEDLFKTHSGLLDSGRPSYREWLRDTGDRGGAQHVKFYGMDISSLEDSAEPIAEFNSKEEVQSALDRGDINVGDTVVVIINGKKETITIRLQETN
tara:strand:+ start:279 stop:2420 length:2142 start_codon:yes stop_codon:yes gene_type:complete